jgi:4a-hydroxytetrahydrobiopterin dehydratase
MGGPGLILVERHCAPGAQRLSEGDARQLAAQIPDWKIQDGALAKTFAFPDFKAALAFVNQAGAVAEQEGHHPDLHLTWGRVDVKLSTHDAGGLTMNDFIMAAKIDRAFLTR